MEKVTMYRVGESLYESIQEARVAEAWVRLEERLAREGFTLDIGQLRALAEDAELRQDLLLILKK